MDLGTQILPTGVRFRLWAPGADRVDLHLPDLQGHPVFLPMSTPDKGWYELIVPEARPGDLYQFRINGDLLTPDPTSRAQAGDIHGPSIVTDPDEFLWRDDDWQGRPWHECILYEIHVGTFTPKGTFEGVMERLDYLRELGITAIELMPVAHFPGQANWGYDGALLFAPFSGYGRPEELKTLVQAAHNRQMAVFLDVVYNHFGPEGNYLYVYARDTFFTDKYHTPWGDAINFAPDSGRVCRDFFIGNALYWLKEYHLDGLRFDAVHAIYDDSEPHILTEIAETVHREITDRRVHLVLENDKNEARFLSGKPRENPGRYEAQWNDDIHHACHVLLTGETGGYYMDYADSPIDHLGRCLCEGFTYQGEYSPYRAEKRGEKSSHLPAACFVSFLQNHDQIGNRAMGERLTALSKADELITAATLILLAPPPPLLFMGEEHGSLQPFYYFCDFGPELAADVTEGRRREFERFPEFADEQGREQIPDPNARQTFIDSRINWTEAASPLGLELYKYYRKLLDLRRTVVIPLLADLVPDNAGYSRLSDKALTAWWFTRDNRKLSVFCNLGNRPVDGVEVQVDAIFHSTPTGTRDQAAQKILPGPGIIWSLQ